MTLKDPAVAWHAKTLRAWQLAILRFAVTLDDADRSAVMSIASEIDRLGPRHGGRSDFSFFRKTSAELCSAILRPSESTSALLRQYLARIEDDRLKQIFAAAVEAGHPKEAPVRRPFKREKSLWRGLSSRRARSL